MLYKVFIGDISGTVTDHVKLFLNFSHLKSYHKNQVHGSHHAQSNIFQQECHNLNLSYLHMEPESGLIFKNISSLANLNSRTKFEVTFKFLYIKLLGKRIQ